MLSPSLPCPNTCSALLLPAPPCLTCPHLLCLATMTMKVFEVGPDLACSYLLCLADPNQELFLQQCFVLPAHSQVWVNVQNHFGLQKTNALHKYTPLVLTISTKDIILHLKLIWAEQTDLFDHGRRVPGPSPNENVPNIPSHFGRKEG